MCNADDRCSGEGPNWTCLVCPGVGKGPVNGLIRVHSANVRSGWGRKKSQEHTLAIWVKRSWFDSILAESLGTKYDAKIGISKSEFSHKVAQAKQNGRLVRRQWVRPDAYTQEAKRRRRSEKEKGEKLCN